MTFDEDFGLFLTNSGLSERDEIHFASVIFMRSSRLDCANYTTTQSTIVNGKRFAASFDYSDAQAEELVRFHPEKVLALATLRAGKPFDFHPHIRLDAVVRIGPVSRSKLQLFRPLVVSEFIHSTSH